MKSLICVPLMAMLCQLAKAQHVKFIWPVKATPEYSEVNDFYSVNNYVDLNSASPGIADWNCGSRTYDGHRGLDIDLWPFFWSMMDNNYVQVVAAADGTVIWVDDNNNNEDNCPGNLPGSWNYIAIMHSDSSTSLYGHIRNNSAMVSNGQTVKQGQPIAYVGSSGNSSNPHLHFEVNKKRVLNSEPSNIIEPNYWSNCNTLNSDSWWLNQKAYKEPNIVRVMTHYAAPGVFDDNNSNLCRSTEDKKAKNNFNPGEQVIIGMAIRDIEAGTGISCAVYKPDGTIGFAFPLAAPGSYEKWYSTISYMLPPDAQTGTYKIAASFQSFSAVHFFSVGCKASETITAPVNGYSGYIAGSFIDCSSQMQAGARLLLQSGGKIRLTNGFRAPQGAKVKARIKDCNYSE